MQIFSPPSEKNINTIKIITEIPNRIYYISIKDNKFIIESTSAGEYKITINEQNSFLEKILKNVNIKNKYIKENKTIKFLDHFVSLENFRDIHCNIIKDLINNNKTEYKHNKIGSFGFLLGDTKPARIQFINLSKKHPNKLIYISTPKYNKNDPAIMSWSEIKYNFKYLIDLPGHTYSTKIYTFLFCKRLIFLFEKRTHEFKWEDKLKPFIHYIPVKNDLSDIIDKFNWAENNEKEVEKIINNAFQLGIKELHPNIMINNFINILIKNLDNL
jgi:hypothetical protein